jgi:plastocyanin
VNANSRRLALAAAVPLLVAVACGGDGDPSATPTSPAPSTTMPATTAPATVVPPTHAPTTIAVTPTTAAPTTAATSALAPATDVDVRLLAFRPDRISILAGRTIRWTQSDAGFHTITSGTVQQSGGIVTASPDGRFDSGQLATDATFELTLTEPGSYEYFCTIHPATMHGVVDVT